VLLSCNTACEIGNNFKQAEHRIHDPRPKLEECIYRNIRHGVHDTFWPTNSQSLFGAYGNGGIKFVSGDLQTFPLVRYAIFSQNLRGRLRPCLLRLSDKVRSVMRGGKFWWVGNHLRLNELR